MSKARRQPAPLARARERQQRDRLEARKVAALERIAAALEAANASKPKTVLVHARPRREGTTLFDPNPDMHVCARADCTAPAELDKQGNAMGWCAEHLRRPLDDMRGESGGP
jgi:hypothetical protein